MFNLYKKGDNIFNLINDIIKKNMKNFEKKIFTSII
jgi:hypothetical protein